MTPQPLLVVDTNVIVAGVLTADRGSPTAKLLDAMLGGTIAFLLSQELLDEVRRVLLRPAIAKRHGLSAGEVDEVLTQLALNAIVPDVGEPSGTRDDRHLIVLLEAFPAASLVTGDLLVRERIGEPRALSPRAAMVFLA